MKAKSTPRFARAATEAQSKTGSNGGKSVGDVLRQPDFKQVAKAGFLKANPGTAEAILLNLVGRKEINGKVIEELAARKATTISISIYMDLSIANCT